MTSFFINKWLTGALIIMASVACNNEPAHKHPPASHTGDSALAADIRRINGSYTSAVETITPENGVKIFSVDIDGVVAYDRRNSQSISSRVEGRIEKLYVRYNRQQVTKGQKIMEIYSPQLAAAQREMLYLAQSGDVDLFSKAKERIRLLGLSDQQITQIIASGTVKYSLPVYSTATGYIVEGSSDSMNSTGGNTSFSLVEGQYVMAGQTLFNIYNSSRVVAEFSITPELASYINTGSDLLFSPSYDRNKMIQGRIGLVEPLLRGGEQFNIARVYLDQDTRLKVGDVLDGNIAIKLKGWWLPATSIWKQGAESIVYRKTGDVFKPHSVNVKTIINGQALIEDVVADWKIAKHASFFRDSDAFVDAKMKEK